MIDINREITKEEYDKAQKESAYVLIDESTKMGYGVYSAQVYEKDGQYYLYYRRGSSCD